MSLTLNDLVAPFGSGNPCGEDLSFSPEFDQVHEARREDDPTVDYGEWQATLKQADWNAVVRVCSELLRTRSKDLRLAAWLAEGWVKTCGFEGLRDGSLLMVEILDRFGAIVHPGMDDGDHEQRIGALSWFVSRMAQLVRQIPLTQAEAAKAGLFSLNDYESARHLQQQIQRNPDMSIDLSEKITLEKIGAAIEKTDRSLYQKWIDDVNRSLQALDELGCLSDGLYGDEGPTVTPLVESVRSVQERLLGIARERGIRLDGAAELESMDGRSVDVTAVTHSESGNNAVRPGPITSREQALESLRQVAAFFRNTEPHSPVAYLADKAVHWGNMPLHAWLRSVVKDHGTLSHLEELLGTGSDGTVS